MGLFDGKTALIVGVANRNSIAWGVAQALHAEGARVGFATRSQPREPCPGAGRKRDAGLIEECDVTDDVAIDRVFERVGDVFGSLDVLVHSIAFADRDELLGRFVDTSREGFATALDISAYSLVALARRAAPLMPVGAAILTMTAYGSVAVLPHYNVMGVAKAALEACVRYLAADPAPTGSASTHCHPGP